MSANEMSANEMSANEMSANEMSANEMSANEMSANEELYEKINDVFVNLNENLRTAFLLKQPAILLLIGDDLMLFEHNVGTRKITLEREKYDPIVSMKTDILAWDSQQFLKKVCTHF
jgi:hypothetical protein